MMLEIMSKIKQYLLAGLILFLPFCVNAAHNFEVKIAVVDVQAILESSLAVQGIRKSIDSISQNIHDEMSKKESELKKNEDEILKKKNVLNEENFNIEVNNFNIKLSEAQKDLQNKKIKLEQAHAESIEKVHEETITIITELSKKHSFNLVLPSSQVLFAAENLNITQEVLKQLNDRLKVVKVNYKS